MSLGVRGYTQSDLEVCRSLWVELTQRHRDLYDDPGIGGQHPGLYFDSYLQQAGPERVWLVVLDGQVAGMSGLLVHGDQGEVEPVIVARAFRGQGVGSALVARAVEEARALKLRYLGVRPVARNQEAVAFFHEKGFRTLGQIELFMALEPAADRSWKAGPVLFGMPFDY